MSQKSEGTAPMEITKDTLVSDILARYGDIADVMEVFGVKRVGRFSIRRVLGKLLTVERAAFVHRVELEAFLGILREAVAKVSPRPLPVGSPEMGRTRFGAVLLCSALVLGCASLPAEPHSPSAHHAHEGIPAPMTQPMNPAEPFRLLTIPAADPTGSDRQVTVLLDAPHVKIVSIRLRNGVSLPEHTTPVPAIIQAASGAGTAVLGAERVHLDAGQLVTLAPSVPHSVIPDPGSELVLLVYHLRGGGTGVR